jgi:hypothetical protein
MSYDLMVSLSAAIATNSDAVRWGGSDAPHLGVLLGRVPAFSSDSFHAAQHCWLQHGHQPSGPHSAASPQPVRHQTVCRRDARALA